MDAAAELDATLSRHRAALDRSAPPGALVAALSAGIEDLATLASGMWRGAALAKDVIESARRELSSLLDASFNRLAASEQTLARTWLMELGEQHAFASIDRLRWRAQVGLPAERYAFEAARAEQRRERAATARRAVIDAAGDDRLDLDFVEAHFHIQLPAQLRSAWERGVERSTGSFLRTSLAVVEHARSVGDEHLAWRSVQPAPGKPYAVLPFSHRRQEHAVLALAEPTEDGDYVVVLLAHDVPEPLRRWPSSTAWLAKLGR